MSSGDGPPYRLTMNGTMRVHSRLLRARAVLVGALHQFTETLLEVDAALRTTPSTWGDPVNVFHQLRTTRYHRVIDRLRIVYAVHMDQPLVWLTNVIPLRGSSLRLGEG
jgi:hypothetical protein